MRCALMYMVPKRGVRRATQRILLLRPGAGGERSDVPPKRIARMEWDRPITCVTRAFGSEDPPRPQAGITAWLTTLLHGAAACSAAGAGDSKAEAVRAVSTASEVRPRNASRAVCISGVHRTPVRCSHSPKVSGQAVTRSAGVA